MAARKRAKAKKAKARTKKAGKVKPASRGARARTAHGKGRRDKATRKPRKRTRVKTKTTGYIVETLVGLPKPARRPAGLQSGDLQGLSNEQVADSESVDELLEEGNAAEAGVVAGVEGSQKQPGKPLRTREVPVDDVPDEYLDKD